MGQPELVHRHEAVDGDAIGIVGGVGTCTERASEIGGELDRTMGVVDEAVVFEGVDAASQPDMYARTADSRMVLSRMLSVAPSSIDTAPKPAPPPNSITTCSSTLGSEARRG